jgi:hypothetical protein
LGKSLKLFSTSDGKTTNKEKEYQSGSDSHKARVTKEMSDVTG